MSNPIMDGQMLAEIAVLKTQVKHLTDLLHDQKRTLEKQDLILAQLTEMANKGKGSLWMLLALGGFIGAVVSNVSTIVGFFKH